MEYIYYCNFMEKSVDIQPRCYVRGETGADYIAVLQGIPSNVSDKGTKWLQGIVDIYCEKTKKLCSHSGCSANDF